MVLFCSWSKLRLASDAQPEIQELARCMKEAIDHATCTELKPGQWHLPYVEDLDEFWFDHSYDNGGEIDLEGAKKCSVARCARVSYFNTDNSSPSIKKDLELYDKLLSSGHLTPFEHQASPINYGEYNMGTYPHCMDPINWVRGVTHMDSALIHWSGNFRSWVQYRQLVSNWNG